MPKLLECFLRPLSDGHPVVPIGTRRTFVGRSADTQIQDPNCSRKQVCLKASAKDQFVLVKNVGMNASVLNGKTLEANVGYEAHHGDIIELIPGKHQYSFVLKYEDDAVKPAISEPKQERLNSSDHEKSRKRTLSSEPNGKHMTPERPTKQQRQERHVAGPAVPTVDAKWEDHDSQLLHIYTGVGVLPSEKIAAYDMDGTLIKTKSGNVFPKSIDDWQIAFPEVPGKLKKLHKDGFKVVIFTNQAGIGKGKVRIEDFRKKIEALVGKLNVPMQVFISTGKGRYRKPLTGMWDTLCELHNNNVPVEKGRSFYVGDAAGRPEIKKPIKRKKDHSSADRLLALNVGINFFTPEVHFQNSKDLNWTKPEFDPKSVFDSDRSILSPSSAALCSPKQEVVLMVGFPGSGKSHFARTYLQTKGYAMVNRDTLGTVQRCIGNLESALKAGKSAVIDNTNPDADSRKRYIQTAKAAGVPCRCFVMAASYKQARHNNVFRELTDRTHATLNDMVFNMYKSKYQEPTEKEGFSEIVKVNFIPKFQSTDDERLFKLFLLDS